MSPGYWLIRKNSCWMVRQLVKRKKKGRKKIRTRMKGIFICCRFFDGFIECLRTTEWKRYFRFSFGHRPFVRAIYFWICLNLQSIALNKWRKINIDIFVAFVEYYIVRVYIVRTKRYITEWITRSNLISIQFQRGFFYRKACVKIHMHS